jgi:two-component system, response regulator, stage 0 sporulation protein F
MDQLKTILYVDDERINLMLFKAIFGKKFNVITAESGEQGLQVLNANIETVGVISDMRMPGMNGIEFIKKAKNVFPELFYFILTGYDITPEISVALDENLIHKYFQKPFNNMEVERAIDEALKNK